MSLSRQINDYLGARCVLVIEPSPAYRTLLKNFFRNLKVKNLKIASSVEDARRNMLGVRVGMFIVEWRLAEKNGLQFCRELRRETDHKNTPFLLLSTENLKQDVVLATEGGIDGYLLKPFSFEDFLGRIKSLLNHFQNPTNLNSVLNRAEYHLECGETWVAEALFMSAENIKIDSVRAKCGLAKIHISNQEYETAKEKLHEAIVINPEYIDAYKLLMQIAETNNDAPAIFENAKLLHSLSPENPRYPLAMAQACMNSGDLVESEKFFRTALHLSPKIAVAHRGIGNIYMRKNDYPRARQYLEKALALEEGDISTLNSLGLTYVKLDMLDEALMKYRIALSVNPREPRVLFNLALALEMQGDQVAAARHLKKAITVSPDFAKAKTSLARLERAFEKSPNTSKLLSLDDEEFSALPEKKRA